jgi:DNA recombination protein RmuC
MNISLLPLIKSESIFFVGLFFILFLIWIWRGIRGQREREQLRLELATIETKFHSNCENLQQLEQAYSQSQKQNEALKVQLAQLQKSREVDMEKLAWIEKAQAHMREAFEALASQTLKTNSGEFLKRAREQVETLLRQVQGDWKTHKAELHNLVDPLKETLTSMSGHVRDLEAKREGAYRSLQEQLRQLARTQSDLQTTNIRLTQALKSPTVRGRWGELQLRRVVEMAGMTKHIAFEEQVGTDGGRPDLIAHLPNGGVLPVDSKVPLEAYLESFETGDEETRKSKLNMHAKAMQSRIQELGQKKYWEQFDSTPDFVVMFVPNEACLGAAFEKNPSLLEYAIEKQVLITTPVTLLALLRVVAYGWQQQQLTENARQIAVLGQELYKRLETFVEHLLELRKDLNKTVSGYNKTVGSLERRLLPAARKFEELGIAATELNAPEAIETRAKLPSTI